MSGLPQAVDKATTPYQYGIIEPYIDRSGFSMYVKKNRIELV